MLGRLFLDSAGDNDFYQMSLSQSESTISPLLMCSECISLSVNFYRKSEGVRMRGHETSSSAQRDVPEFL